MILRKPTIDDADAIAELSNQLGYSVDSDAMKQRLTTLLERSDHHLRVAEMDSQVVGWIQTHSYESLESGFRAEIIGLIVRNQYRRHGIGRQLVEDAVLWARQQSAPVIVVRSNIVREESHRFYPSLMFTLTKTQAVYKRHLEV